MNYFRFENFTLTFTIFSIFTLFIYLPRLFFYKIVQDYEYRYSLANTSFKSTKIGIALNILPSVIRGPLVILINFIISVLTDFKFVQVIKRKKLMTKNLFFVVEGKILAQRYFLK